MKDGAISPFGGGGGLIVITESTTSDASCLAKEALSFVASEVFATLINVARSNFEGTLKESKNLHPIESLLMDIICITV
jgi:hypothetical protein